jgi:hypothetical protein
VQEGCSSLLSGLLMHSRSSTDEREQYHWPPKDPLQAAREKKRKAKGRRGAPLSDSNPFTYGNNGFNPALKPGNSASRGGNGVTSSSVPPWHPNFGKDQVDDDIGAGGEEEDAAQAAGVDTGDSCLPPNTLTNGHGSSQPFQRQKWAAEETDSDSSSDEEEEETAKTMTASRVRRGSEGYEVRPKRYDVAYAVQDEPDYYDDHDNDDYYDDDEGNQHGFDDYGDEERDTKEWDWRRRQYEEEKLRVMLEEDMRRTGAAVLNDPPPDWQSPAQEDGLIPDHEESRNGASSILLPSQIMRRRSQWLEHNKALSAASGSS